MSIRQPIQTSILTSDFRDQAYCFAVESTIMPHERSGLLTVSASKGYLLTTSVDKEPKREQTFKHVHQADGTYLASGAVTLLQAGDSVVDGVVIIRNSRNETLVLTIQTTSTSLVQSKQSALTVSHSTLSFPPSSPDKPSFLILTIAQRHGDVPITLTTDAPDYFQLASDSQPYFSPTLTFTPSAIGSYVHIRYAANTNGYHSGVLTAQSLYEKRTVTLEGHSLGFLPALRQVTIRRPSRSFIAKRWMKVVALVAMGGLAYAGYINRCQLTPALCGESEINQLSTQTNESLPVLPHVNNTLEKGAINSIVTKSTKRSKAREEKQASIVEEVNQNRILLSESAAKQTTSDKPGRAPQAALLPLADQAKTFKRGNDNPYEHRPRQQVAPIPSDEESELERMLNQKP